MNYNLLAPVYDLLSDAYTGGGIRYSKLGHQQHIQPGERVLYAGAGTGHECVRLAARGARVTVLDQSPKMLKICRRRLNAAGLEAVVVEAELFSFMQKRAALGDAANFDVVVAPYFLNVFSAAQLPVALQALVHLLRPGGRMISVDFRAPSSSRVFSWLQRLYYFPPLLLFYTLAHNPWHELYDYRRVVEDSRLPLRLTTNLVHPAWGFPLLETLIWTKL